VSESSTSSRRNRVANYQIPLANGLSHTIISDNGTNFVSRQVASFCSKYKITHSFFTPYYPQGNGQTEINNHTIFNSLCKSLDKRKASGWRNSPRCYRCIGLPSASQQVKLHSHWIMEWKSSSLSTSACYAPQSGNRSGPKRHPTLPCPISIGEEMTGS